MHSSSLNISTRIWLEIFIEIWGILKEGGWIMGRRWWTIKEELEMWARFNTGEMFEDFVVLEKVEFKVLKWF